MVSRRERFAATDLEILVGAGRRPEDFTDDSLGRALDKLARAQPAKVFSSIALAAYTHDGILLDTGHWASTSQSLWGDDPLTEAADPRPAYGHSKDRRPDRKQIPDSLRQSGGRAVVWYRGVRPSVR